MGGTSSVIDSPVFDAFHSQIKRADAFSIEHIWKLTLPKCASGIDLFDLAILFALDFDKDGRFSYTDLLQFSELVNREAKSLQDQDLFRKLAGIASLDLVKTLETPEGVTGVSDWLVSLVITSKQSKLLTREELSVLFQIFRRNCPETSFFEFFRLLKKCDSELGVRCDDDSVTVDTVTTYLLRPMLEHYVKLASFCVAL